MKFSVSNVEQLRIMIACKPSHKKDVSSDQFPLFEETKGHNVVI